MSYSTTFVVRLCIVPPGAPASLAATIDCDDLGARNSCYWLGIQNDYLGFSWPPLGDVTEWASATTAARVDSEVVAPVSGNSYAWNWDGPQSLLSISARRWM